MTIKDHTDDNICCDSAIRLVTAACIRQAESDDLTSSSSGEDSGVFIDR